ncbi:MAG: hypothetical protein V3W44_06380, partial [Dehalococcoidales bacterium]
RELELSIILTSVTDIVSSAYHPFPLAFYLIASTLHCQRCGNQYGLCRKTKLNAKIKHKTRAQDMEEY